MSRLKIFLFLIAIALFVGVYLVWNKAEKNNPPSTADLPPAPFVEQKEVKVPSPEPAPEKTLPEKLLLSVPFTPQAPTANWDELHNEACEEASVLMANAFFQGDTRSILPADEAEAEIEKLTAWQQKNLGYYLSIDSEEAVRMIQEVYGLQAEVVRKFDEDSIKKALSEQKLVLVPVNGRELGNPYFRQPGPIYHMFVIKGYDKNGFIVNEPGTKRGKDYRYTYDTIRGAVGDYDHDTKETDPDKPAIIVVSK